MLVLGVLGGTEPSPIILASRRPAGLWFTSLRWDSHLIKPQQGLFQKHQHHFCLFNSFQPWKGWCQHYDYPDTSSASQEPGQHPAPLSGRCSGQLSVSLQHRQVQSLLFPKQWSLSEPRHLLGGGHTRQKVEPLPRGVWQDLGEKDESKGPVLSGKEWHFRLGCSGTCLWQMSPGAG